MSAYCQQRQAQDVDRSTATRRHERTMAETRPQQNTCRGCSNHQYGGAGSGDRPPQMCPAWGQACRTCGKQNHFEMVSQSKDVEKQGAMRCIGDEEAAIDAFIAHRVFNPATGTYKPGNSGLEELEATIILCPDNNPCPDPRQIRDTLYKPHPEWVAAAQYHDQLLHHQYSKIVERYSRHTHNLSSLQTGDTVAIQSPLKHQWNTTGKVNTALPNHQYRIRVDGLRRITLRNRCFLRKCKLKTAPKPIPSARNTATTPTINTPLLHPDPLTSSSNDTHTTIDTPKQTTYTLTHPRSSKIPTALSRLLPDNRPGHKERHSPHTTRPTRGGDEKATALTHRRK